MKGSSAGHDDLFDYHGCARHYKRLYCVLHSSEESEEETLMMVFRLRQQQLPPAHHFAAKKKKKKIPWSVRGGVGDGLWG